MNIEILTNKDVSELGVIGRQWEIVDWSFFDQRTTGGNKFQFFNHGYSNTPEHRTNLDIPCSLPSGQKFIVESIGIYAIFADKTGKAIGGCSKCGAPCGPSVVCPWCGTARPLTQALDISLCGRVEFKILNRRYHDGLMRGPRYDFHFSRYLVIPSQCNFRLNLELDREAFDIHAVINGKLIRPNFS